MDQSSLSETKESNSNDESDNQLAKYMSLNKEFCKTIVVLKTENARLRNENKDFSIENLYLRNKLTANQKGNKKWELKFSKLQRLHVNHVETLTCELQSYADKLNDVFISWDVTDVHCESEGSEVKSQIANHSTVADDSRRVSRSFEPPKLDIKLPERSDDNASSLDTIEEENEDVNQTKQLEQISLITSTYESTMTNVDSNKENEGPSMIMDSNSTHDENQSTIGKNETSLQSSLKSPANKLHKENFITTRRGSRSRLQTIENNSFEIVKTPELISSTPYKRKTNASISTNEVGQRTSTRLSATKVLASRSSTSLSGRPKRKASPVDFAEPKLNTKLRRPRQLK